jgi:hypothetical protein
MSSSEVMGVGVLAFSFTLHSCFVGITGCMSLKCSSLSYSVASSLIFYALIHWILLLWLGMKRGGHQRVAGAIPGVVALEGFFYPEAAETRWSGLGNQTVRFGGRHKLILAYVLVSAFISGTLFCSAATSSGLFSASGFGLSLAKYWFLDPILP